MTNLPNLTKLLELATKGPWHYDYDGPSLPIISAKPADGFIAFIRDADGSQNRADSNAKLLTVAANNFEALINTVKHLLVGAEEFRDICPGCRGAGELLAKIEREAGDNL